MSRDTGTTSPRFLYVVGRLRPDNALELLPGFLVDRPTSEVREDPSSPLVAELFDASERLLLRFGVPTAPYVDAAVPSDGTLAVRAHIPFPSATRVLRFMRDGAVAQELEVSERPPTVTLVWSPKARVAGRQTIHWRGTHPDGKPLHFFLRYSRTNGKSWEPLTFPTSETSAEIDFDEVAGGPRCRVMVVATDGVVSGTDTTRAFRVDVKPCRAMILAPEDGAVLPPDQPVTLHGQGYYLEEDEPEVDRLAWTSSLDGSLGDGSVIEARLRPGVHRITLRAGRGRRTGETTIRVQVGEGARRPHRPRQR